MEFNPIERAYGFVLPENLDENGSIVNLTAENLLPLNSLLKNGSGYPRSQGLFEDDQRRVTLRQPIREVILSDGFVNDQDYFFWYWLLQIQ